MKFIKTFENITDTQLINIDEIILEKELVLIDTKYPNLIINAVKDGKMPLDKLRVSTMANIINNGGALPPIILYKNKQLKDGHHRYAAYKLAGKKEIPYKFY